MQNPDKRVQASCSANVSIWRIVTESIALMVFDYEGLGSDTLPQGALQQVFNHDGCTLNILINDKIWNALTRRDLNTRFFPPLAYTTSDVIG